MQTARLFQNGQSQAVRLPKEFRFDGDRVYIKRVGNAVVLLSYSEPWEPLFESLDLFSEDFMDAREQSTDQERETLFPMIRLLDTNICIYVIKRKPPEVLRRFATYTVGDLGISSITAAELWYGTAKSERPVQNHQALEQFLLPLLIAPFDEMAAQVYGQFRAMLERSGTPIGSLDTMIAAHALSLKIPLVTNNVTEFSRVPSLDVENWVDTS